MRKITIVLFMFLFIIFSDICFAAEDVSQTLFLYMNNGTAEYSEADVVPKADVGEVRAVKVAFTCDGSGNLVAEDIAWRIDGMILKVIVIPGSTQPDGEYNVVLKDDTGTSVVGSVLDALDGAVTYARVPQVQIGGTYTDIFGPALAVGDIEFDITDNGTADAEGNVWIFFVK